MNNIISLTKKVRNFLISNEKRSLIISLKIIIAAGLLVYIISKVQPANIYKTLLEADYLLISIVFFLVFANLTLQFIKWNLVSSIILNVKDKKKNLFSLFYGISAGAFTPMRLGEYIGRSIPLKEKSFMEVIVATAVDKFINLYILTLFGSFSIVAFLHYYFSVSIYITVTLFLLQFIGFYLFSFLFFKKEFWSDFIFKQLLKIKSLKEYIERISVLSTFNNKELFKLILISTTHFFCYTSQFALLVLAFELQGNYFLYLFGGILMMFSKSFIPALTFAEIGIREGAAIFFLTILGASSASAFNASFLLFTFNILFPALIGMFLLPKKIND